MKKQKGGTGLQTLLDEFRGSSSRGRGIDFTSLTFDFQKESGGATVNTRVYSSVDGFSSILGTGTISPQGSWVTGMQKLSAPHERAGPPRQDELGTPPTGVEREAHVPRPDHGVTGRRPGSLSPSIRKPFSL